MRVFRVYKYRNDASTDVLGTADFFDIDEAYSYAMELVEKGFAFFVDHIYA